MAHGQHTARHVGRFGHEFAAPARDVHHGVEIRAAGGVERGDLTEAVATHAIGRDFEALQNIQQCHAGRADGGLGPLGLRQARGLGLSVLIGEHRFREDGIGHPGSAVPGFAGFVKGHGDIGGHADVLAALAGEHERGATFGLARAGIDAGHGAIGGVELLFQVREGIADGGEAAGLRGVELQLRVARQFGQVIFAGLPDQLGAAGVERLRRGGGEHNQLARGIPVPGRLHAGTFVLFHRNVEVRAAEAKRTERRAAGDIGRADPRARLRVQVERARLNIELRIRPVHLNGGRQNLVVQGHGGLEEIRRARRRFRVADLRLDGAERAPLVLLVIRLQVLRFGEDLAKPFKLGGIPGDRAGAVRFHHANGVGTITGRLVAAAQRLGLAFRHGRIDALRTAIGRTAEAADDRVDPVAIALGVFEAAQGEQ